MLPGPPGPSVGLLWLPNLLGLPAHQSDRMQPSYFSRCVIEHPYVPLNILAAQSNTRVVLPRNLVAHSSARARYLASSSRYRASLSHTRRPCA